MDSLKSCKSLTVNADNPRYCEKTSTEVCDFTVLTLLHRVSWLPKPIDELADPTSIKPLLKYINRTKNKNAISLLNRILR